MSDDKPEVDPDVDDAVEDRKWVQTKLVKNHSEGVRVK